MLHVFYASNSYGLRRSSYTNVLNQKASNLRNWLIIGVFNAFLGSRERCGNLPMNISYRYFREFIDGGEFLEPSITGPFSKGTMVEKVLTELKAKLIELSFLWIF